MNFNDLRPAFRDFTSDFKDFWEFSSYFKDSKSGFRHFRNYRDFRDEGISDRISGHFYTPDFRIS